MNNCKNIIILFILCTGLSVFNANSSNYMLGPGDSIHINVYNESDFELSNYFSSTHPSSKHTTNFVISVNEGEVTKFMFNETFSIMRLGKRVDRRVENCDQLRELLSHEFRTEISTSQAVRIFDNYFYPEKI